MLPCSCCMLALDFAFRKAKKSTLISSYLRIDTEVRPFRQPMRQAAYCESACKRRGDGSHCLIVADVRHL